MLFSGLVVNNYPTILIAAPFNPIGESLLRRFVRKNCNLILMDQNASQLEQAQNELGVFQARIKTVYTNWHDSDSLANQIEELYEELEQISVLVSLLDTHHSVENLLIPSISDAQEMMNLNFFANTTLVEGVLPMMSEENTGSIVILGNCQDKNPSNISYHASKAALNSYLNTLQTYLGEQNVQLTQLDIKINQETTFNNSGDQISGMIEDLLFTEKTHRVQKIEIG